MSSFVVGLDLDGVCYSFDKTARYMIRRRISDRGETPAPELYLASADWDWISDHCPKEDWKWLWTDGVREGLFRYGHVVSGAIEGVRELNKLGDVVAITARPKAAVHDTMVWLATFFDKSPLAGVVIQSRGERKSAVRPTPDVYIDDGTHNFDDILSRTNASMIQFWQPWNHNYRPAASVSGRHYVCDGWQSTVATVRSIKENSQIERGG